MIKRIMNARGTRKFLRNHLAVFSLGIIGLYTVVFVAVLFGLISRQDTEIRVLNRNTPGFLQAQSETDRYNDIVWHYGRMERVFDRDLENAEDPRRAFGEIALAERTIVDAPLPEVIEKWEAFSEVYETLDNAYLDRVDLLDEQLGIRMEMDSLREEGDTEGIADLQEELDEINGLVTEVDTEFTQALADSEAALDELMPIPSGWDGFIYKSRTFLGSDVSGRSISARGFYSIKTAFQIGFVVATLCVVIGTLLGAAAAFYGGWIDAIVMWLVSTLSSVPYLVLLAVLAFMFTGNALFDNPAQHPELQLVKLYTAMGLTFWISTCRVIRGEVMKIKELEYVQAATAIGFGKLYILVRHVIPNTAHIMFINFSLLFIGAIKSEVILSFLGLGVTGQPSWGTMISNAKDDLSNYFFWEVLTASILLFVLVLAFNIVSDALQDAFDPRHVD